MGRQIESTPKSGREGRTCRALPEMEVELFGPSVLGHPHNHTHTPLSLHVNVDTCRVIHVDRRSETIATRLLPRRRDWMAA